MNKKWFVFWALAALEAVIAIGFIFQIPSEGGSAVIFGLSLFRLLLVLAFVAIAGFSVYAAARAVRSPADFSGDSGGNWRQLTGWVGILSGFAVVLALLFFQPPLGDSAFSRAVFERIKPLLGWGGVFSIQTILLLAVFYFEEAHAGFFQRNKRFFIVSGFCFLLSAGLIFFALATDFGLRPISGTFYRQGVSLLEGQLIVPLLVIFALMLIAVLLQYADVHTQLTGRKRSIVIVLVALGIWVSAAHLWINIPFEGRSYFLPALRLPNNNFYPASDAENYDLLAQSILMGNGFRNGMTVVRPFYVAFLALLHALVGNDYLPVTNLQIIVVALFPAAVFWIGQQLKLPFGGFLAAIWVIFREIYSIRLTPLVQVSNSRLFMSDLPTALLVALLLIALISWLQSGKAKKWAIVSGGLCGVGFLIRTQAVIFLPAVILFILLSAAFEKRLRKGLGRNLLLFLLSFLLVVSPWLILNQVLPNQTVSAESSEGSYLIRLYQAAAEAQPVADPTAQPAVPAPSLFAILRQSPKAIGSAIHAHFMNNELSSLLILPVRTAPVTAMEQWFNDPDVFWYRVSSREALAGNLPLILAYLAVLSIGVGGAVKRAKGAGILPLYLHLVYAAGTSAAMTSGFRFILPVDWIVLLYFGFGCVTLMGILLKPLARIAESPTLQAENDFNPLPRKTRAIPALLLCLVVGLILPFMDQGIPLKYKQDVTYEQLLEQFPEDAALSGLRAAVTSGELQLLTGRAVYPRYYAANEGDSGGNSSIKRNADTGRLVWMVLNERVHTLALPGSADVLASESIPDPLEIAAIGTYRDDYFEAVWVGALSSEPGKNWYSDAAMNHE